MATRVAAAVDTAAGQGGASWAMVAAPRPGEEGARAGEAWERVGDSSSSHPLATTGVHDAHHEHHESLATWEWRVMGRGKWVQGSGKLPRLVFIQGGDQGWGFTTVKCR